MCFDLDLNSKIRSSIEDFRRWPVFEILRFQQNTLHVESGSSTILINPTSHMHGGLPPLIFARGSLIRGWLVVSHRTLMWNRMKWLPSNIAVNERRPRTQNNVLCVRFTAIKAIEIESICECIIRYPAKKFAISFFTSQYKRGRDHLIADRKW